MFQKYETLEHKKCLLFFEISCRFPLSSSSSLEIAFSERKNNFLDKPISINKDINDEISMLCRNNSMKTGPEFLLRFLHVFGISNSSSESRNDRCSCSKKHDRK